VVESFRDPEAPGPGIVYGRFLGPRHGGLPAFLREILSGNRAKKRKDRRRDRERPGPAAADDTVVSEVATPSDVIARHGNHDPLVDRVLERDRVAGGVLDREQDDARRRLVRLERRREARDALGVQKSRGDPAAPDVLRDVFEAREPEVEGGRLARFEREPVRGEREAHHPDRDRNRSVARAHDHPVLSERRPGRKPPEDGARGFGDDTRPPSADFAPSRGASAEGSLDDLNGSCDADRRRRDVNEIGTAPGYGPRRRMSGGSGCGGGRERESGLVRARRDG